MSLGCSLRFVCEDVRDATIKLLAETGFADLAAPATVPWLAATLAEPDGANKRRQGGSAS